MKFTKSMSIISLLLIISAGLMFMGNFDNRSTTLLVTFNDFTAANNNKLQNYGVQIEDTFNLIPTVKIKAPASLIPIIEKLDGVKYVQTEKIYTVDVIPNDPDYNQLWGMDKISAPAAWDVRTDASSVIVAVIDTGVQITHPDLAANIWTNPNEIAGNGIDDDNNGYIDDVNGWDFQNNDASVYDSTSDDHGTHVSGTIGGVGNNGIGVAGVSWKVQLMPLKFIGSSGGSTADAISAIQYAAAMGADIISASWGGGSYDQTLKDAIDAFPGLFVAAAGNDGVDNDVSPHYPSSYTSANLLAVASTTDTDALSSFSNYGATSVDIAAPGSNIYSTWPSNTYNTISGTSMATPHVSGAAALVLANDPTLTPTQLKAKLMDYADPVGTLSGKVASGGRLNVYASLTGTAPPPPPPTVTDTFTGTVSSTAPDQVHYFNVDAAGTISASLSWAGTTDLDMYLYAPGVDPYSSSYLVRAYTTANPESMSYSATTTGQYAIRVNFYSGSTVSYTLDVTHPAGTADTTPPAQVTGLTAATVSDSQIDLSWNANSESDLANYKIYRDGTFLTTTTATSFSDTGLTASTTYSYTVSAVDTSSNEGTQSVAASATTNAPPVDTTPPAQVTGLTATAVSSSQIDLSWNANSESDLANYKIYRDGTFLTTTTATSFSDTGLTASTTYSYTVSAVDTSSNEGTQSVAASATTTSNTGPITETFTGTVSSTTPDQVFYFDVGAAGDISATLSWVGSTDLDMYLYAPGVDPYSSSYLVRAYTTANPETLSYTATTTGQYAIRVNFYSGSTQSFTLSVTHPPGAPTTTVTETFTGTVSSTTPDQVFYFDVGAAGDISATLSWVGSTDLDMYLYAPGVDPYSSSYLVRAYTTANPETLSYTATTTGQYAIRVNFYSGSTQSFTLSVTHPALAAAANAATPQITGFILSNVPDMSTPIFALNVI